MPNLVRPIALAILGVAAGIPAQQAQACPPPPPGYVAPTREQWLERSLSDVTDIVYGVVTRSGAPGQRSTFKILHVYRGSLRRGDKIEAAAGWGHPAPDCLGMMSEAHPQPAGAYGVVAFRNGIRQLNFITPDNVQIMIAKGWIKSARTRQPSR